MACRTRAATLLVLVPTLLPDHAAQAQPDEEGSVIEEVIVVGTRREGRTLVNTPVPVDVLQGSEFRNLGSSDMNDMLRTLLPSYNVTRYPLDDELSLVRPARLRGLPPAYTLVLLNGKRRHRSGALNGSQAADLAVIPAIALKRVEVLRDGASAQYGSDAIAGVINFVANDSPHGGTVELKTGEFYAGDGHSRQIAVNGGLPLTEQGFLNLAVEYGDREPTTRAIQDPAAQVLQELNVPGIPDPAQTWGQPRLQDEIKSLVNAAVPLGQAGELYGFGNYARRDQELPFYWRNPNGTGGIFTLGPERLVMDVSSDGTGNCPIAGSPDALLAPDLFAPSAEEVQSDRLALDALRQNPDCWTVNELHPAGYRPRFGARQTDYSMVLGYRTELDAGAAVDISGAYGSNELDFQIWDTVNASLGPQSPTSFNPGATIQTETSINLDAVWPIDTPWLFSPLNLAAGLEWRDEAFEKRPGDTASWLAGPFAAEGATTGSHGYPGIAPQQSGKWHRENRAAYVDLEADATRNLLLGLALRYEDFEDFGSTTNYKATFRYAFSNAFAIRGSVSSGFRAPTPAMLNSTSIATINFLGALLQEGTLPPTNPVSAFYGGKPLEPEESRNLSVGFTLRPLQNLLLTLDYFDIEIDGRIQLGPTFEPTPEDVETLAELGIAGAGDLASVRFLVNSTERRTKGLDLVASYVHEWATSASTSISIAWNYTDNRLSLDDFADRWVYIAESNMPAHRGILTAQHHWQKLRLLLRLSYYGKWAEADWPNPSFELACTDERPNPPQTDHCYGDEWVVDAEAAYAFGDHFTVVIGAENVLDNYPERSFLYPEFSSGRIYPDTTPMGYQGGFWYARLIAEL